MTSLRRRSPSTLLIAICNHGGGYRHLLPPHPLRKARKVTNPSLGSWKNEGDPGPKTVQLTVQLGPIGSNWPSLPSPPESSSPIPPGQKVGSPSVTPTTPASPWKIHQRDPEDCQKDRVGKYAEFFVGNEILPIPEIVKKVEPRIVSLVVTDLKTRRLVGLKRESFEDLLRTSGVPCQYLCRKSFATWDVLMPAKEQAAKIAVNNISICGTPARIRQSPKPSPRTGSPPYFDRVDHQFLATALDWSKLISAASSSSFIPSMISRIKCKLSWIDLPLTA